MSKEYPEDSLGNRIKEYESAMTERYFMAGLPLYARLDGRAFHTFTRGFGLPFPDLPNFDLSFQVLMQRICARLVKETNAAIGYVQSDEISLGWTDVSRAPFDRRIFKLTSVLPSIAGVALMNILLDDRGDIPHVDFGKILEKAKRIPPSFDCRVFQLPSLMELANTFVWRENDAIKNSISSYAQAVFSRRELEGKNQTDRLDMLLERGYNWKTLSMETRRGTYFARKLVEKTNADGEIYVRTVIEEKFSHDQLAKIENKVEYLFEDAEPILINRSNNNGDARRV